VVCDDGGCLGSDTCGGLEGVEEETNGVDLVWVWVVCDDDDAGIGNCGNKWVDL